MNLLFRFRRAWRILVQDGFAGLVRAIRGYSRPYEYFVYRRLLTRGAPPFSQAVKVRPGSLEELKKWRDGQEHVASPFLGDRTAGWSDFCWAWSEGHPVGIVWTAARSPLLFTGADEGVIVDLYTIPSFRGRGVASALIEAACQHLRQHGQRVAYATVEIRNTPSSRAFNRCGFDVIGRFKVRGWLRHSPRTGRWSRETVSEQPR